MDDGQQAFGETHRGLESCESWTSGMRVEEVDEAGWCNASHDKMEPRRGSGHTGWQWSRRAVRRLHNHAGLSVVAGCAVTM